MSFISRTILFAAQLNAAFSTKADLDPVTSKVRADQLPDAAAIAHEELDAQIAAAAALAQSAHDLAATADTHATAAGTAATNADTHAGNATTTAAAAQAKADAAIPLSQKGAANGVPSLGSDGKVPASQLPPSSGGGGGTTLTPPSAADFSFVNGAGCGKQDGDGGMWLNFDWIDQNSGSRVDAVKRAAPATPYTIVSRTRRDSYDVPFIGSGLGWRDPGTGKMQVFLAGPIAVQANPGGTNAVQTQMSECRLASPTVFDNFRALPVTGNDLWWRLRDDGTTRSIAFSRDGKRWTVFWQGSRTEYLANPAEVCVAANLLQIGTVCPQAEHLVSVLHWSQS